MHVVDYEVHVVVTTEMPRQRPHPMVGGCGSFTIPLGRAAISLFW